MSIWALFRKIASLLHNRYRPELHYMRGPGPKWLEVHGGVKVRAGRRGR
jgi:hypothetical protein